jgi:hypothetical protein
MRLNFKVKAKNHWNDYQRRIVKTSASWVAGRLALSGLPLTVSVRLVGDYGTEYGSVARPYDDDYFVVWIHAGSSTSRTVKTVFHEFTHIAQYCYEGLVMDAGESPALFRGVEYSKPEYWASPWEVEARRSERKLFQEWRA